MVLVIDLHQSLVVPFLLVNISGTMSHDHAKPFRRDRRTFDLNPTHEHPLYENLLVAILIWT